MNRNPELTQFYQDILRWAETGFDHEAPFRNDEGLCANLEFWGNRQSNNQRDYEELVFRLGHELEESFKAAGLNRSYPFNDGNAFWYSDECTYGKTFENPRRMAWIKEHAA